jgi:hypothetical protein
MKYTVYYFDDQAHPNSIEANTAKMAAWQFVHQHPRTDASQITVESQPSVPWRVSQITHYRACDLINTPKPSDEGEPDLFMRVSGGVECSYVVSGSIEALRSHATLLLKCLNEFPNSSNTIRSKHIYGFPIVRSKDFRQCDDLSFVVDPNIEQQWMNRSHSPRSSLIMDFLAKYGRFFFRLLFTAFACIGIWTFAKWIF